MRAALLVAALGGGCYAPQLAPCEIACATGDVCPAGLVCSGGLCAASASQGCGARSDGGTDGLGSGPQLSGASARVDGASVHISWMTSEDGTARCTLDGAPISCLTSEARFNAAAGDHTFAVQLTSATSGPSNTLQVPFSVTCPVGPFPAARFNFPFDDVGQLLENTVVGYPDATRGPSTDNDAPDLEPSTDTARFFRGLRFESTNLVTCAGDTAAYTSLTIEMWIKPRAATFDAQIFSAGAGPTQITLTQTVTNRLRFQVGSAGVLTSTAALPTDTWVVIAAVWRAGAALELYFDGVPVATDLPPASLSSLPLGPFTIGAGVAGGLEEVTISSSPETQPDILSHYCPE